MSADSMVGKLMLALVAVIGGFLGSYFGATQARGTELIKIRREAYGDLLATGMSPGALKEPEAFDDFEVLYHRARLVCPLTTLFALDMWFAHVHAYAYLYRYESNKDESPKHMAMLTEFRQRVKENPCAEFVPFVQDGSIRNPDLHVIADAMTAEDGKKAIRKRIDELAAVLVGTMRSDLGANP